MSYDLDNIKDVIIHSGVQIHQHYKIVDINKEFLPDCNGIYIIYYNDDRYIYVGASKCISKRLMNGHNIKSQDISIIEIYATQNIWEAKKLERMILDKYPNNQTSIVVKIDNDIYNKIEIKRAQEGERNKNIIINNILKEYFQCKDDDFKTIKQTK